jgi:tetratricopeptide (TPR) repeat protein
VKARPARGNVQSAEEAFRKGDLTRAEDLLRHCLQRDAGDAHANELLAYVLGRKGDSNGVYEYLSRATALPAASPSAWYYLGVWLRGNGRLDAARDALEKAVEMRPDFFEALHDLGTLRLDMGARTPALDALDRAATLRPDAFEVFHNRGRALQALHRHEEAITDYDRALALRPGEPATLVARGEALCDLKRYDEALAAFAAAEKRDPGNADALWNESLLRLTLGQLGEAWPKYEYRWKGKNGWPRRHLDLPAWDASIEPAGKTILVWWEQGFGDTLHFCRYVPMLVRRGARVVFEVQTPLKRLLSCIRDAEVIQEGDPHASCDFQVPLLSLPLAFGTTLATIPADVPYLSPDPALVAHWKERLRSRVGKIRLAIACAGNLTQKDNVQRSMGLAHFAALKDVADMYLVAPELGERDRAVIGEMGGAVEHVGASIQDFADTAAVVANMDAVVTIDTSLAHLAGALAKPLWIALPWTPTWRWMVDRTDSPWYPTARLFRAPSMGNWTGVLERIRASLVQEVRPCC